LDEHVRLLRASARGEKDLDKLRGRSLEQSKAELLTVKTWLHERDQKLNITELQNSALQNEQATRIRALERELKDLSKLNSRLEITKYAKDKEVNNSKIIISNLELKSSNFINDINNINNSLINKNSKIDDLNKTIEQKEIEITYLKNDY